jgi:hypothetical protein
MLLTPARHPTHPRRDQLRTALITTIHRSLDLGRTRIRAHLANGNDRFRPIHGSDYLCTLRQLDVTTDHDIVNVREETEPAKETPSPFSDGCTEPSADRIGNRPHRSDTLRSKVN